MKKCIILLLLPLIGICCTSCRKKHVESYGYVWYETIKNGRYGAEDEAGNILLPNIFYDEVELDTFSSYNDNYALNPCRIYRWRWPLLEDSNGDLWNIDTWEIGRDHNVRYSVCSKFGESTIYYEGYDNPSKCNMEKRRLLDSNFNIIYEGHFDWGVTCSYNHDSWQFAGDMGEIVLFKLKDVFGNHAYPMFIKNNGDIIIPSSRKYREIIPHMIDNYCFYIATINDDIKAILDNRGTELFRYLTKDLRSAYHHTSEGAKGVWERFYDANIASHQWAGGITYDTEYGFGIIEPYKDYPGWSWEEGYDEWDEHYTYHPDILWTHLMLPEGSGTFDVNPSFDNRVGKTINLIEIAATQ